MSSMESNLQELQNLLSNTLNDSDDIHLKLSQVLYGTSFNNNENKIVMIINKIIIIIIKYDLCH